MPIREVGRSGERKNPRGRRKKRKKAWVGRLGAGLKHHLGAIDLGVENGAKLGANNPGTVLLARSASTPPTWTRPRRQTLWR